MILCIFFDILKLNIKLLNMVDKNMVQMPDRKENALNRERFTIL
ncbi:MAG: hypothetical protein PHG49_02390 [Candidatus Pacebacteria bacterium]|nr:hypothetical protein [Candidatus Paceibacterota bacterium]